MRPDAAASDRDWDAARTPQTDRVAALRAIEAALTAEIRALRAGSAATAEAQAFHACHEAARAARFDPELASEWLGRGIGTSHRAVLNSRIPAQRQANQARDLRILRLRENVAKANLSTFAPVRTLAHPKG